MRTPTQWVRGARRPEAYHGHGVRRGAGLEVFGDTDRMLALTR